MAIAQGDLTTPVNPTNYNIIVDAINANTVITAALSSELQSLTAAEIQQLQNIGAVTISNGQWTVLGGLTATLTAAEVNFLDGVTSAIQTQLNTKAADADVLKKDGSVALTSAWDAGSFSITAETLVSDVATGTAPLTVASTTVVTNLNADSVDGFGMDQAVLTSSSPTFVTTTSAIRHKGNGVFDVKAYDATGNGSTDDQANINTAHTAATASGGVLYFPGGASSTYRFSTNQTFNSDVTVVFGPEAKFAVDTGVTITINGKLVAGLHQIFALTGTGVVTLAAGSCEHVLPQWWGAAGDDSTDNHDAIEAAIAAAGNSGKIYLPAGTYRISDAIDNFPYGYGTLQTSGITLAGASMSKTIIKYMGLSGYAIKMYNPVLDTDVMFRACNDITITDMRIEADQLTSAGGGIQVLGSQRPQLKNLMLTNIEETYGTGVNFIRRPLIVTEDSFTNDTDRDFTSGAGASDQYAIAVTTGANVNGYLKSLTVRLGKTGAPAGTITASIYSDSSGPDAIVGSASNTVTSTNLSAAADGADQEFTFDWYGPSISASTKYWIVLIPSGYTYNDGVTEIRLRTDSGAGGADNFGVYDGGATTWSTTTDGSNNIFNLGKDLSQMCVMQSVQIQGDAQAAVAVAIDDDSQVYLSDCNLYGTDVITSNGAPFIRATRCNIDANGGRPLQIGPGQTSFYQCYMEGSADAATASYFDGGVLHRIEACNLGYVDWSDGTPIRFGGNWGGIYLNSTDPTMYPDELAYKIYTSDTVRSWGWTMVTVADATSLTGTALRLENNGDFQRIDFDETGTRQLKFLALGTYLITVVARDAGTPANDNITFYASYDGTGNVIDSAAFDATATYQAFHTFMSVDAAAQGTRMVIDILNNHATSDIYISHVIIQYMGPDLLNQDSVSFNTVASDADGARLSKNVFVGRQSGNQESYLATIAASHDGAADDEKGKVVLSVNDGNDGFAPTSQITIDSVDVTLERGVLALPETTTPTPVASEGRFYTKADSQYYFQDGDGVERRVVLSDYAGIYVDNNAVATTVLLVDAWEPITIFDADMPEVISNGAFGTYNITVGETGVYEVSFNLYGSSAGTNKVFEFFVFEIAAATQAITGATEATPCVVTATGHSFTDGQYVKFAGIGGMVELNGQIYKVANKDTNTFELTDDEDVDINSTGYTTFSGAGTAQLATKLRAVHAERKFAVIGDVGAIGSSGFVSLTAGNTLEMHLKCITSAHDITIQGGQFTIRRV